MPPFPITRPRPAGRLLAAALALWGVPAAPGAASPDYPALLPLSALVAAAGGGRLSEGDGASLEARATRLRARAEILRTRTPIDPATRARMGLPAPPR